MFELILRRGFRDYIPFYFGGHSPMLLNIKTGYRGIRKRPQDELIYIVCRIKDIVAQCPAWCFTDGHAKNKLTEFYNDIKDLTHVDWEVVCTQFWGMMKPIWIGCGENRPNFW